MVESLLSYVGKTEQGYERYQALLPERFDLDSCNQLLDKVNSQPIGKFAIGTLKFSAPVTEILGGEDDWLNQKIVGVEFWYSSEGWVVDEIDSTHTSFMGMNVYRTKPALLDSEIGKVIFGGWYVTGFDLLFVQGPYS